ncbi:MAG: hypothetical protein WA324_16525, partial [Bryobacteraceae bacterium]
FANATVKLLGEREYAAALAERARDAVVRDRDADTATRQLAEMYLRESKRMRPEAIALDQPLVAEEHA